MTTITIVNTCATDTIITTDTTTDKIIYLLQAWGTQRVTVRARRQQLLDGRGKSYFENKDEYKEYQVLGLELEELNDIMEHAEAILVSRANESFENFEDVNEKPSEWDNWVPPRPTWVDRFRRDNRKMMTKGSLLPGRGHDKRLSHR